MEVKRTVRACDRRSLSKFGGPEVRSEDVRLWPRFKIWVEWTCAEMSSRQKREHMQRPWGGKQHDWFKKLKEDSIIQLTPWGSNISKSLVELCLLLIHCWWWWRWSLNLSTDICWVPTMCQTLFYVLKENQWTDKSPWFCGIFILVSRRIDNKQISKISHIWENRKC